MSVYSVCSSVCESLLWLWLCCTFDCDGVSVLAAKKIRFIRHLSLNQIYVNVNVNVNVCVRVCVCARMDATDIRELISLDDVMEEMELGCLPHKLPPSPDMFPLKSTLGHFWGVLKKMSLPPSSWSYLQYHCSLTKTRSHIHDSPNGGLVYAFEYINENQEWLHEQS